MRPQKKLLKEQGITYVGLWEPPYFVKQLGSASQNTASMCDFFKTEEYVRHLAGLGVNQIWCNFSKGYGLKFEHAEQVKIRRMCGCARKHGLMVLAYCTGGSLTPETLRRDFPGNPGIVDDMVARRADGRLCSYGNDAYQVWRCRPDYTSPVYMAWQKRVIKKALDFGCHGIHFDNTDVLSEPAACRCSRCARMFREFVRTKYGGRNAAAGMARWGRADFRFVTVPWYDEWNDPVMQREIEGANSQAWLLFRQQTFNACLAEWADYIHSLGGICEYNCGKSLGFNYRAYSAINDEIVLDKADIFFNESAYPLGYTMRGAPITRVREHKIAQAFDIPMITYNDSSHQMAEAFAFNPGMLGMWSMEDRPELQKDRLAWFKFYHKHKHYQTWQESLAETAVYMQHESLTFSIFGAYMTQCALTQLLQEERIPFNLAYKKDLAGLERYKLLIVADAFCLTEAEAAAIGVWVRKGGHLLTVGRTGERDDNFLLRTKLKEVRSVADLSRAHEPENVFTPLTGESYTRDFIKKVGRGMAAHITKLVHAEEPRVHDRSEWMIRPELLHRPENSAAVMKYIDRLLPDRNIAVVSGADLLVDLCRRRDTGEGIVHIFNVAWAKGRTADATVTFRWNTPVNSLTRIGWDIREAPVKFKALPCGAVFKLKGIRESAVVIVNKE
ncbi:MAG: hypothetical protein QME60_07620 [Verrucomicrobiota bacterium]|nr:hypothetical protein [Verrucomicrobiota bacterium]